MKSILPILLLFAVASQAQSLKVEWTNVNELYDTVTYDLKPGPHKVIVKKTVSRKSSFDTINIQIMGDSSEYSVNYMPKAFAGNDTTWTFGKTATVKGIGQDVDGTITAYKWSKIKGPTAGKISYSTRATTTLTGLVKGEYTYQFTVTDNNGGKGYSTVKIKVQ